MGKGERCSLTIDQAIEIADGPSGRLGAGRNPLPRKRSLLKIGGYQNPLTGESYRWTCGWLIRIRVPATAL